MCGSYPSSAACALFALFVSTVLFAVASLTSGGYKYVGDYFPETPPGKPEGTEWDAEAAARFRAEAAGNAYVVATTWLAISGVATVAACVHYQAGRR